MPRPASKSAVDGSTLSFHKAGDYTIHYLPSGNVKIKLDGGHSFVMKVEEYAAITTFDFAEGATISGDVNVDGVIFDEADPDGTFSSSHDLDDLIEVMIATHGVAYTIDHLSINGSTADTFKAIWDYLDDEYGDEGPSNDVINENFIRLGAEYVGYLEAGGEPLTFVTAKFSADTNGNGIPQREQSMHDNLLGNVTDYALDQRFRDDPELLAELSALIPQEYRERPLHIGTENDIGETSHDAVRAFDYDKGWDRPDYLDRGYDALIDPLARDGGEMYYGDGNTVDDWNVVRHEGAQVELGLKIKHRQGGEYDEGEIDADGVAHYDVLTGAQPGNPNRAEWNFDFAATDYSPDDDFTYVVELDIDPTEGIEWATIHSTDDPHDTDTGTGETFQNSFNVAFVDLDPEAPGTQHYGFGEAEFNVRISAYDAGTNSLVAVNEVVVHVGA